MLTSNDRLGVNPPSQFEFIPLNEVTLKHNFFECKSKGLSTLGIISLDLDVELSLTRPCFHKSASPCNLAT